MNALKASLLITAALLGGACKSNNSGDTDKAAREVRKAQDELNKDRTDVAKQADTVAKQQAVLDDKDHKLGSAQADLTAARAAYTTAIQDRLAKLDANLAQLSTKTDAKAKDAYAGLRARRDALGVKLGTMGATPDTGWTPYTKDLDTTFDAIESDTNSALR